MSIAGPLAKRLAGHFSMWSKARGKKLGMAYPYENDFSKTTEAIKDVRYPTDENIAWHRFMAIHDHTGNNNEPCYCSTQRKWLSLFDSKLLEKQGEYWRVRVWFWQKYTLLHG